MNNSIPWVEKYRPTEFDNIVLDPLNKHILSNIIQTSFFPNLLLYGPPGTGKTTTIINLVNSYQKVLNQNNKGLMIHLNASDERGIDIIRNQINQFVNSKSLFNQGMKFVILDEVDYMTKNAQQALKYLLQNYSNTVRFCLICNYISRIDEGLQNEFIKLRFNQLPENAIIEFLKTIVVSENLSISNNSIKLIQQLYKSDIRSMINYMQSNQNIIENEFTIIDEEVWQDLFTQIQNINVNIDVKINDIVNKNINNFNAIYKYIYNISLKYNINIKNIIKDFINYIIRNKSYIVTSEFLLFVENIMHFEDCKNEYYVNYFLSRLSYFIPKV
jgi:replication factor C subunit 3/5